MLRWIYKPVAAWQRRGPRWLQAHILILALGLGAGIIFATDILPRLGYHRPVHLPITTVDTTGPTGWWAGR